MSGDAKTATRGAKDLTIISLCASLLSFAGLDGGDPRLLTDERPWLCDRRLDGDLDFVIDGRSAMNGRRDSEADNDVLILTKDEGFEAVMAGRSLDVSPLDGLKASSGCGRSDNPPGLPISGSEDVIDGESQSLSSFPA